MCGRYYIDDEMYQEIQKVVQEVDSGLREIPARDVRPSGSAPVVVQNNHGLYLAPMNWGFPRYDKKGLVINARAETVLERRMFRDSVLHRRCLIPARHFYEWDREKNKVTFSAADSKVLYMAGFYQSDAERNRFVILTTAANESMIRIHDRMPLILESEEIESWIMQDELLDCYLKRVPRQLKASQEYEQQTLPFL